MSTNRDKAILEARKWLAENPLFLDTETTGLFATDEVVEVAIIDQEGVTLLNKLVRPTVSIHPKAAAVHKITAEMLATAPSFGDIWPELRDLVAGRTVIAYNAMFDTSKIAQSRRASGVAFDPETFLPTTWCCAMLNFAQFYGDWDSRRHSYAWQSLDAAARFCKVQGIKGHRALADAEITRQVLLYVAAQPTYEESHENTAAA